MRRDQPSELVRERQAQTADAIASGRVRDAGFLASSELLRLQRVCRENAGRPGARAVPDARRDAALPPRDRADPPAAI